jgi:hypothetical protein
LTAGSPQPTVRVPSAPGAGGGTPGASPPGRRLAPAGPEIWVGRPKPIERSLIPNRPARRQRPRWSPHSRARPRAVPGGLTSRR